MESGRQQKTAEGSRTSNQQGRILHALTLRAESLNSEIGGILTVSLEIRRGETAAFVVYTKQMHKQKLHSSNEYAAL